MEKNISEIIKSGEDFLKPVGRAVSEDTFPYGIKQFLDDLGLASALSESSELISELGEILLAIQDISNYIQKIIEEEDISNVFTPEGKEKISNLVTGISSLNNFSWNEPYLNKEVGQLIIENLIVKYLAYYRPAIYSILDFTGIIKDVREIEGQGNYILDVSPLKDFVSSPKIWFEKQYGWSENLFYKPLFIQKIIALTRAFKLFPLINNHQIDSDFAPTLKVPFFSYIVEDEFNEIGFKILPISFDPTVITGIRLMVYGTDRLSPNIKFQNDWELVFNSSIGENENFWLDFTQDGVSTNTVDEWIFQLRFGKLKADEKIILLGEKDGSKIETSSIGANIDIQINDEDLISIEIYLKNSTLTIDTSNSDGFIKKIIPIDFFEINFDFSIGWSNVDGLYFKGSSSIEVEIPIHKAVGFLELKALFLRLAIGNENESEISAGISFSAQIGPISAIIDKIGLRASVAPEIGGNLGLLNFSGLNFLSPSLIGIAVSAPLIAGGGFLNFDQENARYAGGLSLKLGEIEITAICLITTRLPDGSKGFSMLVAISTIFVPPIQLSFGFTLSGIGGLIGINRTMKVDVLKERFKTGAIESIMFPKDPIENADQIIGDLRAVFPPKKDNYVIAPFIRLGYGTPNLITADIGLFIDTSAVGQIIVLGSLGVILPTPEEAVVQINVDVIGDFNISEEYIEILGTLRDSNIMGFPLTGDFAFLLSWGSPKAFMLSIGGYHPDYQKPARFPTLNRLQVDFSKGKNMQIHGSFYHAITSNTVQLGLSADIYVKQSPLTVDAKIDFDALFVFKSDFYFKTKLDFSAEVKWGKKRVAGALLHLKFEGPAPFIAIGYGNVKVLGVKKDVDFNFKWGPVKNNHTPAIDPKLQLIEIFNDDSSWGSILPPSEDIGVALSVEEELQEIAEGEEAPSKPLILHPAGALEIRQNLLPLDKRIEIIGNSPVTKEQVFSIRNFNIGGKTIGSGEMRPVEDFFARSHFEKLNDEEKLAKPDFELFSAGIEIGGDSLEIFGSSERVWADKFEEHIINKDLTAVRNQAGKGLLGIKSLGIAKSAAARELAKNPMVRMKQRRREVPDFVNTVAYQVQDEITMNRVENTKETYSTYAAARTALLEAGVGAQGEKHQIVAMREVEYA